MDIKPDTKVELLDGTKGKIIGQLESGEYMVKSSKKGEILYCDLCRREISTTKKIDMINKANRNKLCICDECYKKILKNYKKL